MNPVFLYLWDVCIAEIVKENDVFKVKTFKEHILNANKYHTQKEAVEAAKRLVAPNVRDTIYLKCKLSSLQHAVLHHALNTFRSHGCVKDFQQSTGNNIMYFTVSKQYEVLILIYK